MSWRVTGLIDQIRFGERSHKLIALKLASCANDDGTRIFPAVENIAISAECHPRTVQRALKLFQASGLLWLTKLGGRGPRNPNEYAYNMPVVEALASGEMEIYFYQDEAKKRCMGVREMVAPDENKGDTVSPIAKNKGDTVPPLNAAKGDMVSNKGDTVSKKGDTVSPNSINTLSLTKGGACARGALPTGRDAPSPSLFQIFEEFIDAAEAHDFLIPSESQFNQYSEKLKATIAAVGLDDWREFLALAGKDELCTGRVPPREGWAKPWRLSIKQATDPAWVSGRLAQWRGESKAEAAVARQVITRGSKEWFAVKNYYEATGQEKTARVMAKADRFWMVRTAEIEAMREWQEKTTKKGAEHHAE